MYGVHGLGARDRARLLAPAFRCSEYFTRNPCPVYYGLMIFTSILKPRFLRLSMLTPLIVLAVASLASAQTTTTANPDAPPTSPSNPTMAGRYQDNAKENLYARFSDFKRNPNPEQQRYAYPTAKEY